MSSLFFIKIPFIEPTTISVFLITLIFAFFAFIGEINIVVGFTLAFLIGLISGVNNSQGMEILQENKKTKIEDRENVIVVSSIISDLFIVLSFISSLAFANYIMPYN